MKHKIPKWLAISATIAILIVDAFSIGLIVSYPQYVFENVTFGIAMFCLNISCFVLLIGDWTGHLWQPPETQL